MISKFLHVGILITISSIIFSAAIPAYAETMGSIAITLTYTNGDTADYTPVSLKIYQDFNTTPYKVIESISGNPFNIVSLPIGHHYKIETYVDGLHANISYVDLEQSHEDLNIIIPLSGGMRLDIFYNDGLTPISNATAYVRSLGNNTWGQSSTNAEGETLRFWLEPTVSQNDNYTIDVKIGEDLVYSQSPVFLNAGIPQEVKIITNWPPLVNSLVTVKLLDEKQNHLISKDKYVVDMFGNGNKISESLVTSRGESYFSNIKVGDYQFKAINVGNSSEWGNLNATIDGTKTTFSIFKSQLSQVTSQVTQPATPQVTQPATQVTQPDTPKQPMTSCNCVAFRLDNIQDYWLDDVQSKVIDVFEQKGQSITIGIIGNAFGNDSKLVGHLKTETLLGKLDAAMNGWNFEDFTTFNRYQQKQLLEQSKNKISSSLGTMPSIFIPPYGKINNDTLLAMSDSGTNFLSSNPEAIQLTNITENIHNFPAKVNGDFSIKQNRTNDVILSEIKNAINSDGFAIVTLSFQDYAQSNGTVKINSPDPEKIQNLQSLIDSIKNNGYKIVTIKDIANPPSIPEFGPFATITLILSIISVLVIWSRSGLTRF